jgi:predicted TPR repeat methyltransferase
MPQDLLQIALEHHRGGRLRRAEEGYRSILAQDPKNTEAAQWLGVLMLQAGRADEALPLLERAVASNPHDAAYSHNLGQAYLTIGRLEHAIAAFDRAISSNPASTDALFSSGIAHLARSLPGDAEAALTLLNKAQLQGLGSPELHQHLAVALLMTGRTEEAIAACRTAIERKPDYAEPHYHLGVALLRTGKPDEARQNIARAVELKPDYARALHGLAGLEAEAGRLPEAEALLRSEVCSNPQSSDGHHALGLVLQRMGKWNDATVAFIGAMRASRGELRPPISADASTAVMELEQRITPTPEAASLQFRLASKTSIPAPAQVPAPNVSGLFDRYADLFDEHLLGKLDYRAPELIVDAVRSLNPGTELDVLDLGCGTGLCGPLLRPMSRTLVGVDLSAPMIEKARERNVYDRLETGDILQVLQREPKAWDLLVAADVLMYLGDLAPTFEAAAAALRPGGTFAFSVEAGPGDRYQLRKETQRFTHSRPYLHRMASIFGFQEERLDPITLRKEANRNVPGLLMLLRRP